MDKKKTKKSKEQKFHHYNLDGLELDVPLKWFDLQDRYIENLDSFIDDPPKFTSRGHPVIFTYNTPCSLFRKGAFQDCIDCPFFRRATEEHFTLLGICTYEENKNKNVWLLE